MKKKYTKNNKLMAFVTIEDLYGSAEVIVFENAFMAANNSGSEILIENNIVMVEGRISIREDEDVKIVANKIYQFGEKKQKKLVLDITDASEQQKEKLRGAIKFFSGDKNNTPVYVKIGEDTKSCGSVYLTKQNLEIFEEILNNEKVIYI